MPVNFIPREPYNLWGEVLETESPLGGREELSTGQGLCYSRPGSQTVPNSFFQQMPRPLPGLSRGEVQAHVFCQPAPKASVLCSRADKLASLPV